MTKKILKSNSKLGRELDLYFTNDVIGKGLPLLTPKGATIKRELERFIEDEELKRGYMHTDTPVLSKTDLYKISGHLDHYRDDMFIFNIRGEEFALRPMTCPFQFMIYKNKQRSYRELPIKYAETSILFRNEKKGELMGLTRLRQFTLADAHVICRPDQLEEEFKNVLELNNYIMKTLKIEDVWYQFSKWNPKDKKKYVDNPKAWRESQAAMKRILDKLKLKYVEADGKAAFYGPKLDTQYKNVFGKEDTLITVQIDFALPEKFNLTYVNKDNKLQRPMIIHRSSIGCFERTIAYLLEKTQGNLPLWLSPIQVKVISFMSKNDKKSEEVAGMFKDEGLRVETDLREQHINAKVREAELMKVPYILVIGDKEEKTNTLAVRKKGSKPEFGVKIKNFIKQLKNEIKERK